MLGMAPESPNAYQMPRWAPQPEEAHPAKRQCLPKPADLWCLVQQELEESTRPASEELASTVFVPTGCAVKLHLEGIDLLLEPDPGSVMRLSLPGHTILLVPEDLQASSQHGQPVFWPAAMQQAAVVDVPQDHHVCALHQGFNSASLPYIQGFANVPGPHEDTQEDFVMPLMNDPSLMAPEILSPFRGMFSPMFPCQMPYPWSENCPPSAGRYAPWSVWSLQDSILCPLPASPLQPLPPSPPPSPEEQASRSRQKPPMVRRKAQRRLVF